MPSNHAASGAPKTYAARMSKSDLTRAAATRRALLGARLGGRPALIPAGSHRPRNYPHNPYPYRASSHFLYLVGLAWPGAVLRLDGDDQRLLLPARDPLDALWHGEPEQDEALAACTGLRVGQRQELAALVRGRGVALPPVLRREDALPLARALDRDVEQLGRDEEIDAPLLEALIALRLCHDEAALHELRRAAEVSVDAHLTGMRATRAGAREHSVVAAMESVFTATGFTTAYGSIVSTHGEVLHNEAHDHALRDGDLLLADVGAETDTGYAADVTRTWPVSGRFSATQREIYQLVLEAQAAALRALRPGARYRDVHLAAMSALCHGLRDVGILRGDPAGLLERGAHALFMPHGIGHLLGLDVHDMEDLGDRAGYAPGRARAAQFGLSYLRLDRDLAPGMLVTIEPGFYQVPFLLREPERVGLDGSVIDRERLALFADVRGIRIEDDVLVTAGGHELLTARLPKEPDAIEAILAGC
jgi:Xaa-Pro aminopeptidase